MVLKGNLFKRNTKDEWKERHFEVKNGFLYYTCKHNTNCFHIINFHTCSTQPFTSAWRITCPGQEKWIEVKVEEEATSASFAALMNTMKETTRVCGEEACGDETPGLNGYKTNPVTLTHTADQWRLKIEEISSKRCDLDILLKDEWRHKVAIRDNYTLSRNFVNNSPETHTGSHMITNDACCIIVEGYLLKKLQSFAHENALSIGALALSALHLALGAYGHGTHTVVALVDAKGKPTFHASNLIPSIVDHSVLSSISCLETVSTVMRMIHESTTLAPTALLQQGLFDAALVMADESTQLGDISPLPLVVFVQDNQDSIHWTMHYSSSLFEPKVIDGFLNVVYEVLSQLTQSTKLIRELDLVSSEQQQQLVVWNATDGSYPSTKRLNNLFEDAALHYPNLTAIISGNIELKYHELDSLANRMAHWLLSPAVSLQPTELVVLYIDKSYFAIVAILAIWKAGAAFCPIDTSYPAERVSFTLRDTKARCIIANQHHSSFLRKLLADRQIPAFVVEVEAVIDDCPDQAEAPSLDLTSSQLAYLTYTSGTTGVPKGVTKQHFRVVNSITDLSERYDMKRAGEERVALFASYVFEPFMRQMLIALINSQTLVIIADNDRMDPSKFSKLVADQGITYLNATGSVLQHFNLTQCPSLRKILLVGEELTPSGLRQLHSIFKGHIINEYGFTESAFVTAIKEFPPTVTKRTDRSIGKPLRNVKCYVLSCNLKQVPIGAIGDLYIGGLGVSCGYWNRDDLTAERFLANPFQSEEEKRTGTNPRIYKTGDLARMLPNGELEYMGRSDFQLKINGVRIEPGEIETRASAFTGIRKCVVVARDGPTGRYLVGYFTTEPGFEVLESDLVSFLEERLIRCMVPARMIHLQDFPVNVNGKVDWRALPDIAQSTTVPIALGDHLLDTLRNIWATVLNVPVAAIVADSNFFRLGGHSVSYILLIGKIRQQLQLELSFEDVFAKATFRDMGNLLQYATTTGKFLVDCEVKSNLHVLPNYKPLVLMANGLQQGLMFHAFKETQDNEAYVMQSTCKFSTVICVDILKQAWEFALRRFASLRLRFEWNITPQQIIETGETPLDWRFHNISELTAPEQEQFINDVHRQDYAETYDLRAGRLFRVYLIQQQAKLFTLVFSCHHIILDGWSFPILHHFVHNTYLSLMRGETIQLQSNDVYVEAQLYLEEHRNDHVDYWTEQLSQLDERGDFSGLITEPLRYKVSLSQYDNVKQHKSKATVVDVQQTSALLDMCTSYQITLHSALQFVWHKVLHAFGGGKTTVIGTITSGRNLPVDGIERSVGLFINTLPLVVDHSKQASQKISEALADIQAAANAMNNKSVIELGRLKKGTMKHELFDMLFVLENYPDILDQSEVEQQKQLACQWTHDIDKVNYPLAVVAKVENKKLTVTVLYAGELFEDSVIDVLFDTMKTLISQISNSFEQPTSNLELVSSSTLALLDTWNNTTSVFPEDKTLHSLFETVAARYCSTTAVVYKEQELTYTELNEKANLLAHYLLSITDLHPNDMIALVMDKSDWMIVTIFAVWKAGAAYVPIDPTFPKDRVGFMLEDTRAKLIITNHAHAALLAQEYHNHTILDVETLDLADQPKHNLHTRTTSTDLAYAIYTSGTTGKPKAVLVEHKGVVNLQVSLAHLFGLSAEKGAREVLLSFSNYVFDHFVEQMTDALLNGQTLVVLDDEMRGNKAQLYDYINRNQVTYLSGTPSVLSLYDFSSMPSLKRIDAIGEDFTPPVFDKIRSSFSGLIINGYGPTEISITSHKRLYCKGEHRSNKSIGFPVANTACYVLNMMKRLPVGAVGELYIGGIGVARGYLNRDDLTAYRFVSNPFQTPEDKLNGRNARLYRTGDLARWLPNGELEYLGRNDQQVKINGQRVELAEVEAALASCPGVTKAVIVAQERLAQGHTIPQKHLVGFYVGKAALVELEVKQWMRSKLPPTLVPSRVLQISEIPITINGKLDVRRLPLLNFANKSSHYVPPSSEVEVTLCRLWSTVIGIPADHIGVHDEFITLGGDSIRSIELLHQLNSAFLHRAFNLGSLFKHTTIAGFAQYLQNTAAEPRPVSLHSPPNDLRVSLAQERLLFINDFENGSSGFNIPFVVKSNAPRVVIKESLSVLLGSHAALRTQLVRASDGLYYQNVLDTQAALASLLMQEHEVENIRELDAKLVIDAKHTFLLDSELPIRIRLYTLSSESVTYLSLVMHHTCFDGWSWAIFKKQLAGLLRGSELSAVHSATYLEYAALQRQYMTGDVLTSLQLFWATTLAGFEPLNLLSDHPRPPRFNYSGKEIHFTIDCDTTNQLRALASATGTTLFSLLLSAYSLMLSTFAAQKDIVIGTPVANRSWLAFSTVIGFFANLVVLRVRIEDTMRLIDYIQATGSTVVQAQVHQEYPFEHLVKSLGLPPDPSRHPIVQVVFSLLDQSIVGTNDTLQSYTPNSGGWTSCKYDLSATVFECPTGLAGNFTYCAALFDEGTVASYITCFKHILQEYTRLLTALDTAQLREVSFIDSSAPQNECRNREAYASSCATMQSIFEATADKWYSNIAVCHKNTDLTYCKLNKLANQLAHYLISFGLQPNDIVALLMDKSEWTIVVLVALWKAGVAYVPIDPTFPSARIEFILADTKAKVIVTHQPNTALLQGLQNACIVEIEQLSLSTLSESNPPNCSSPDNLAYMIYTSGTTGKPKGTRILQKNIVSFYQAVSRHHFGDSSNADEVVLLLSNYVFDFSVEQLALAILGGNKLLVPVADQLADDSFYDFANLHKLTYLSGTPTQIQQFDLARLASLRTVTVAGEPFQVHQYEKIRRHYKGLLINAYGTTETSVYNTVNCFGPSDQYINTLGKPISNTKLHVLNSHLQLLPDGAVGELFIAGPCVGAGYLNQPKLTSERFLENPYQTSEERASGVYSTLYRTGDIVRYRWDHALEYIGRNDTQVKINGLRVELSEIEAVLASHPSVCDCVVIAAAVGDSKSKRLIGYYVPRQRVDEAELTKFLRTKLPPGMVPIRILPLSQLPMTINGKLDIGALPSAQLSVQEQPYSAPRTTIEQRFCRLWSAVLPRQSKQGGVVGIDTNFFHCGGDSMLAMQLTSQMQREFKQKISVKHIFDSPTIRSLLENLDTTASATPLIVQDTLTGSCPMLPIQNWFFTKPLIAHRSHWNQYFTVVIPHMDIKQLQRNLIQLAFHHDAFWLRYRESEGAIEQFYNAHPPTLQLHKLNVKGIEPAQLMTQLDLWQSEFDLEHGPTCCAAYLEGFESGKARLWIAMHHLIVDVVSWRVIAQDLCTLYHGGDLGPRGPSYRQWAKELNGQSLSVTEVDHWNKVSAEILQRKSLAPNANNTVTEKFMLGDQETQSLLMFGALRIDELLLTAVGYGLQMLTNQSENYVTVESHGREFANVDVRDSVGWFTTMHPVALSVSSNLNTSLEQVQNACRCVPRNGIGYGILKGTYGGTQAPLPEVSFNYLGQLSTNSSESEWSLDPRMCGTSKSAALRNISDCLLDITMHCADGKMVCQIDSAIGQDLTHSFVNEVKQRLQEIAAFRNSLQLPLHTPPELDYVVVNEHLQGPVLFVLPPGEGGAESYLNNIAKHLPHIKLVLFDNVHLRTPFESFEALARFYNTHVKILQPKGPYHFLGWSFGGVLSLQMAIQLAKEGEKIASLTFIDSYFNVKKASADIGLPSTTDILDPINFHYQPRNEDLRLLEGNATKLVLFKADKPNEIFSGPNQQLLFNYYATKEHNNLDTLVSAQSISVEHVNESHHSWVRNEDIVSGMCASISSSFFKKTRKTISDRAERFDEVTKPYMQELRELMKANQMYSSSNPTGVINLCLSENSLSSKDLIQLLEQEVKASPLPQELTTYVNVTQPFLASLAEFLSQNLLHGRAAMTGSLDPSHFMVSAGSGPVLSMLAFALCDHGEGILIPSPSYPGYDTDVELLAGVKPIHFSILSSEDPRGIHITRDRLDAGLTLATQSNIPVRALILSSPNNPTGCLFSPAELRDVITWCEEHEIHLIADENFAFSCFGAKYESISDAMVSLGRKDHGEYVHIVWGFSKDFCASGLRLGIVYSDNLEVIRALRHQFYFHLPSSLTMEVFRRIISQPSIVNQFCEQNNNRLREMYSYVSHLLTELHNIPFFPAQAGFFVVLDLRSILPSFFHDDETKEGERMWIAEDRVWKELVKGGVVLNPGSSMGSPVPGLFRMCYAGYSMEVISEAVTRIARCLQQMKYKEKEM